MPDKRDEIDDLQDEVQAAIKRIEDRKKPNENASMEKSKAFRAVMDFTVGIALGGFVGYIIDGKFGTSPIFTFILVIVGMAAGTLNAYRTAQDAGYAMGYRIQKLNEDKQAKGLYDDEDEED